VRFVVETLSQRRGIDEVAIVRHADSVWAVHVERLCLCIGAAASGRVSKVAEAHEAGEVRDAGAVVEDLGCHAVAFALVEASASAAADYACRILTAVLQKIQRIVDLDRGGLRFSSLISFVL
jgi:hypothetical protein